MLAISCQNDNPQIFVLVCAFEALQDIMEELRIHSVEFLWPIELDVKDVGSQFRHL